MKAMRGLQTKRNPGLCALCAIFLWLGLARAQAPTPVSEVATQWQASFDAFAAADREHAPPPGGVVFVGSSSIRLWDNLETYFTAPPVVIKRGFGGSEMSDCARYLNRLVLPYKPRLVLVYAGDNDLAEGKLPEDVARSFAIFVDGIHKELPATRIGYISIKPSPARAALLPRARRANELIRQYVAHEKNLEFIDVFTPMLDAEGKPRAELFRPDALHLNADGYALWRKIIGPYVR